MIEKLANVIGRIKRSGTRQMDYDNLIELITALSGMVRVSAFMAHRHPNGRRAETENLDGDGI